MAQPDTRSGRRPVATRNATWARSSAIWLARRRIHPNSISMASVLFAALAAGLLVASARIPSPGAACLALVLSAILIQARLICNLLDGLVAVEGGLGTKAGEIFNDFPDRVSDTLLLVAAGYSIPGAGWAQTLGWLAAALALLTAYSRVLATATGAPSLFLGPMAKQHRMAVLTAACLIGAVEVWVHRPALLPAAALAIVAVGCVVTTTRRLSHAIRHLGS